MEQDRRDAIENAWTAVRNAQELVSEFLEEYSYEPGKPGKMIDIYVARYWHEINQQLNSAREEHIYA